MFIIFATGNYALIGAALAIGVFFGGPVSGGAFNPAVAMAGKITVVEVEEIVETGEIAPDQVHLPGIYVHRLVLNANPEKRIEKRTITETLGV